MLTRSHSEDSSTKLPLAIEGLTLRRLVTHADERGALTEMMRTSWLADAPFPVQWNYVRSKGNVLRGVHVHVRHWDYLVIPEGEATIGLVDLRKDSPTFRLAQTILMSDVQMSLLVIPPGIAHGFYFARDGVFTYGLTHYWDPVGDEFGCRWNDPALGLHWGEVEAPLLSPKDRSAGSLDELLTQLRGKADWCGSA